MRLAGWKKEKGGRCNEEEAQGGGIGDSMHPEREVVVVHQST